MNDQQRRKELVRGLVTEYLEKHESDELEDLELVFEPVYRAVEEQQKVASDPEDPAGEHSYEISQGDYSFDTPFTEPTAILAATWIATQLLGWAREAWRERRWQSRESFEIVLDETAAAHPPRDPVQARRLEELRPLLVEHWQEVRELAQWGGEEAKKGGRERRGGNGGVGEGGPPDQVAEPPARAARAPRSTGQSRDDQIDVTLTVREERGGGDISLFLHLHVMRRELGISPEHYRAVELRQPPESYLRSIFKTLENLSLRSDEDREVASMRLRTVGVGTGGYLLPEGLQEKLRQVLQRAREKGIEAPSLLVISNETWVPWELLRVPQKGDDDAFVLAEAFAMTRWLPGADQETELPLTRLGLVVPQDSGLPQARVEESLMKDLFSEPRTVEHIPARTLPVLKSLGGGSYDAFHFSGHGHAEGETPDRWGLLLDQGDRLFPGDLEDDGVTGLGDSHPLVFLNACYSGKGTFSLTSFAGLIGAFVQAGAGAVVGSYWALWDDRAPAFAVAFYQYLLAGYPLGEATRQARLWFRKQYPGDPTWLAYTVFGHPGARAGTIRADGGEAGAPA